MYQKLIAQLQALIAALKGLGKPKPAPKPKPKPKPAPKPVPKTGVVMYDSITITEIPNNAKAAAGYVGGKWPTYKELVKRLPGAKHLSIAVNSMENAECLDVESGDATPAQAPGWVHAQIKRGVRKPVVYTSLATADLLLRTLEEGGVSRGMIRLWTAHYSYKQHRCTPACGFGLKTTADATQWTDRSLGRNLDESICSPTFFG